MKNSLLFIIVLVIALTLRLYGLNWDQGHHLHPDERFLTMVVTSLSIPDSLGDYMDPAVSTLNPYNHNYDFFVYGTLPTTLVKIAAVWVGLDTYDGVVQVGRLMSALLDVSALALLMFIVFELQGKSKSRRFVYLIAGGLYAVAVIPIQMSHFFTTDTFAHVFQLASLCCAVLMVRKGPQFALTLGSAVMVGFAAASKISAVYITPLIGLIYLYSCTVHVKKQKEYAAKYILQRMGSAVVACLFGYLALRVADPRLFESINLWNPLPSKHFLDNLQTLKRIADLNGTFPPNVQWINKPSIIYPLRNIVLYGLGLPYAVLAGVGIVQLLRKGHVVVKVCFLWVIGIFAYQGSQDVMTMRYFYILYPFFAWAAAEAVVLMTSLNVRFYKRLVWALIAVLTLLYPVGFMSIYSQKHTRVQASEWIYENIPAGSVIAVEHWDDALPLSLQSDGMGMQRSPQRFTLVELPVFGRDTIEKQLEVERILKDADYWILSSNRGYGSIMTVPERYPYMGQVYRELFSQQRGFTKVAEFTSYPRLPLGQFVYVDDFADESFTVYDHPKVLIYRATPQ